MEHELDPIQTQAYWDEIYVPLDPPEDGHPPPTEEERRHFREAYAYYNLRKVVRFYARDGSIVEEEYRLG